MKCRKYVCESCGEKSSQTHLHHILPKSKGGLDISSNLVEVCPPCHQKIHSTKFNDDANLIKLGLRKVKGEWSVATDFLTRNREPLVVFCEDFCDKYETEVLHEMMRFGVLSVADLVRMIKGEKSKKNFGQVSSMVQRLHKQAPHKYRFVYEDVL